MHFLLEKSLKTSWFDRARTNNYRNWLFAFSLPISRSTIIYKLLVTLRHGSLSLAVMFSCVLIGMLSGIGHGNATATDSSRSVALESVYEHAGLHAHLSSIYSTVVEESQLAWQACENVQDRSRFESMLKENLSITVLRQDFLNELNKRINDEHLEQIVGWTQSEAGKSIYQAELESRDLDEPKFASLLQTYQQSEIHGDERNVRLRRMLADTGAAYFLSAFNTELSALVSMASVCSNSKEALLAAQKQITEDRSSEALYRSFMRRELLIPSAVVYRNITDAQLDALSVFADSDAGDAYFTALIKGVRSLLAGKVDRLSETLETMPINTD